MSIKRIGGLLIALSLANACANAPKTLSSFHSGLRLHAERACVARCMNQSGYGVAVLSVEEQAGGTLHVTGEGQDLVLAPDESGEVLYERGFSWGIRPDDPFEGRHRPTAARRS